MVVAAGIDNVPLPESVPPVHDSDVPVMLTLAVPLRVPPAMSSVGIDCGEALLTVSVPPERVTFEEIVPLTVLVPETCWYVPAPLIELAASNVRLSLV